MANLSLSEEVVRFTQFSLETDLLSALFISHCTSDLLPGSDQYKLGYAILTWYANLIQTVSLVKNCLSDKPLLISGLIGLLTCDLDVDFGHRLVFLLDDLRDTVKLNKHIP